MIDDVTIGEAGASRIGLAAIDYATSILVIYGTPTAAKSSKQVFKGATAMFRKTPILLFLPFLLIACSTVQIPPPRFSSEDFSFIKPGITTRDELISKLGVPTMLLSDIGILLYRSFENKGDRLTDRAVSGPGAIESVQPNIDSWAMLVAVDESDHVVLWGLDRRSSATDSLVTQARSWAESQGLSVTPLKTSFASLPTPAGKGVIYIYNKGVPSSLLGYSWPFPVAVAVDGQYVTEMRVATYVALPVSTGRHEISVDPAPRYSPFRSMSTVPVNRPAPIKIEMSEGQTYYFETSSTTGWGSVDTSLASRSEDVAMPVLRTLRPVW